MNGRWKSGKPEAKVTENGSKMKMRPKLEGKGQKSDIPFSGRGPRGGDPGEEAAPPPLGLLQQGKAFFCVCYHLLRNSHYIIPCNTFQRYLRCEHFYGI